MACPTKNIKFQLRRDTAANWDLINPFLLAGEPGYETDTFKLKIGNGVNYWRNLPYTDSVPRGNIVPAAHNTYSLGTPTIRWKDAYLGAGTLYVGDVSISTTDNNVLTIQGITGPTGPVSIVYGGNTLVSDPLLGVYTVNQSGANVPVSVVGPTGPTGASQPGPRGVAVYYGTDPNTGYTGPVANPQIGDLFINTITGQLFIKNT